MKNLILVRRYSFPFIRCEDSFPDFLGFCINRGGFLSDDLQILVSPKNITFLYLKIYPATNNNGKVNLFIKEKLKNVYVKFTAFC